MKTFFKRLALCLGGILILLILFHLVENWRGKRAWKRWKQARIAAGESFDVARLIPPEVPDAENFARAPRIAESVIGAKGPSPSLPNLPAIFSKPGALQEWRMGQKTDMEALQTELKLKDLREVLTPWETELTALCEAAKRPHCRLVKNYEHFADMPQLLGMRSRARMLSLRALIALREKRADAALEDVLTGLRVAGHLQKEPHLITQLLRLAWMNILMQPIWEGLQEHRWKGDQLVKLQEHLQQIDLVESYKSGWQLERMAMLQDSENLMEGSLWSRQRALVEAEQKSLLKDLFFGLCFPKGWLYQSLLHKDRQLATQFTDVLNPSQHRIEVRASQAATAAAMKTRRSPYTLFSIAMPALTAQNLRMARTQSGLDMAIIACALERHRLDKGHYPETLAALVPTYLTTAPVDVLEGQPLHFTAKTKDSFQLYSLGWNLTDEGGQVAPKESQDQGDWVWSR